MTSIRKALLFGFLVWLLPFIVAVVIFPLRETQRPLFESIMPVALSGVVVVFAYVSDITVTYLMIPIVTGGLGVAFEHRGASPGLSGR